MDALILTGMMAAGKSSVGRAVAARWGWSFVDLDDRIAADAGRPVAAIFEAEGEAGFRERERAAVRALAAAAPARTVIATGGWTCGDAGSRARLAALGPIVCLTASAATLVARLIGSPGGRRPPLDVVDDARVEALLAARQPVYDALPLQVDTDGRDVEVVAEHVIRLANAMSGIGGRIDAIAVRARVEGGIRRGPRCGYGVVIGPGLLDELGTLLAARGIEGTVAVVTDANVGPIWGGRVLDSLRAAGITAALAEMGAGEPAKSLATVERLYEAFVAHGLDRDAAVIALGGGVVGDTAGFAAATYLRGATLVTVPTTLLAMVDAAVGGKTGVNLPAGKNLAGSFWQPVVVVADPGALATLPSAVLREGLAEVVKAAIIGDAALFEWLERDGIPALAGSGDPDALGGPAGSGGGDPLDDPSGAGAEEWSRIIASAVRVKAALVGEDPRELRGQRVQLNLGHTFAHALERATRYELSHGRAVAVGLVAAARLAERVGAAEEVGLAERVERLLGALGLPARWHGAGVGDVVAAMGADKKRRAGRPRFVLPCAVGRARVVEDVPLAQVEAVLAGLRQG